MAWCEAAAVVKATDAAVGFEGAIAHFETCTHADALFDEMVSEDRAKLAETRSAALREPQRLCGPKSDCRLARGLGSSRSALGYRERGKG